MAQKCEVFINNFIIAQNTMKYTRIKKISNSDMILTFMTSQWHHNRTHFQENCEKLDRFSSKFGFRKHHAHSRNNKIFSDMLYNIIFYNFTKYEVVSWVCMYFSIPISVTKLMENLENQQIFKTSQFSEWFVAMVTRTIRKQYLFSESHLTQCYFYRFLFLYVDVCIFTIFWAK